MFPTKTVRQGGRLLIFQCFTTSYTKLGETRVEEICLWMIKLKNKKGVYTCQVMYKIYDWNYATCITGWVEIPRDIPSCSMGYIACNQCKDAYQ